MDITFNQALQKKLTKLAQITQKSEQQVIIEALEKHLETTQIPEKNCYDLALELGVIAAATDLPNDLSTNSDYFKLFLHLSNLYFSRTKKETLFTTSLE
ncbi:hypothetical protein Cyast_2403 [Cyanobacterium stanieri PCC 7202]|uniref:Uncharacterized protein n=1 Tax=Cyanobacterium stanieri (strain ATCC 29140 / PCC 7202) TaxID=292563 RepID=K9YNA6_CYASC|nr:hypothetical protein Cyast_2403 [Cyanobacterium stanieri PCC 7202]